MKDDDNEVYEGSGNVFADLGRPDADELLAKYSLARRIREIIESQKLTQVQAAELLGVDQPKISTLVRGQLKEFSTDRLFRFLNILGQDVEIVITEKPKARKLATVSVAASPKLRRG